MLENIDNSMEAMDQITKNERLYAKLRGDRYVPPAKPQPMFDRVVGASYAVLALTAATSIVAVVVVACATVILRLFGFWT